jgi:hypothetical protein
MGETLTKSAQFIAVCSSSILAETLGYAVSFSSPWRGKRRVLEWASLSLWINGNHLQMLMALVPFDVSPSRVILLDDATV